MKTNPSHDFHGSSLFAVLLDLGGVIMVVFAGAKLLFGEGNWLMAAMLIVGISSIVASFIMDKTACDGKHSNDPCHESGLWFKF